MTFRRKLGHKVKPRSTAAIEELAKVARDSFSINGPKVKVCHLIEALQEISPLTFEILEDYELGEEEARAFPDKNHIQIKNSIYEAACDGCGHAAFTIAHELGHIFLHKNEKPSFARSEKREHKIYEDSEWQADTFASAFLMDSRHINVNDDVDSMVEKFGVTPHAAQVRLSKIKKR